MANSENQVSEVNLRLQVERILEKYKDKIRSIEVLQDNNKGFHRIDDAVQVDRLKTRKYERGTFVADLEEILAM